MTTAPMIHGIWLSIQHLDRLSALVQELRYRDAAPIVQLLQNALQNQPTADTVPAAPKSAANGIAASADGGAARVADPC